MSLYEDMKQMLIKEKTASLLEDSELTEEIHTRALQALERIQEVLANDELNDKECFWRIEAIVKIYEEHGLDAGNRHDFS